MKRALVANLEDPWDMAVERHLTMLLIHEVEATRKFSKTEGRRLMTGVLEEFPELYDAIKGGENEV
jgi:hypothetical protein